MKFDMHCHTKAGSFDAKVPLEQYVQLLKKQGFDGMLVTDHDSYKGYRQWKESEVAADAGDFVVLAGVEYDTKDAGHFIVIMPDDIFLSVLQVRGMALETLIEIVHRHGGILGPAHPCGNKSSSAMFFKKVGRRPQIFRKFDFVEGFNTCESARANRIAHLLAMRYGKPCTGGSDAHEEQYIGMGFTEFDKKICTNADLIDAIKTHQILDFGGVVRGVTRKSRHKDAFYGVWGFKVYNRSLGFLFAPYRRRKIKKASFWVAD